MKCGTISALILVLLALAVLPAVADAPPLPLPNEVSKIGGYPHKGYAGANPGLIGNVAAMGKPMGGRLGAVFSGPTIIDSFTITQVDEGGRRTINSMDVYADGKLLGTVSLPSALCTQQTIYFADFATL